MNFLTVLSRLTSLPGTFLRSDSTFESWEDAQTFQLSEFCTTVDALVPMAVFQTSAWGWVDVWGELFGIPRNPNEANQTYFARIQFTLQFPVGSAYAISTYSTAYWGQPVSVVESSGVGYSIQLPSGINPAGIPQYIIDLERIRPAGVPFTLNQLSEYTFLNTGKYLSGTRDAGAYLGGGLQSLGFTIPEPIINSQPILPTLLVTDPLLNGGA